MTQRELLTVEEVATFLRVQPITVYRWCRSGKLKGIKIGKEWRIAQNDLDRFLASRARTGPSPSLEKFLQRQLTPPEHVLVMTSDPEDVYRLQAQALNAAIKADYPLFIGSWWQDVADMRERLRAKGMPVAELEASGKLALADLGAVYAAEGTRGVINVWEQQAKIWEYRDFWGIGTHRLAYWNGRYDDLFQFEAELDTAIDRLPAIVMCQCLLEPADRRSFDALLSIVPHHSSALFMSDDAPILMRPTP